MRQILRYVSNSNIPLTQVSCFPSIFSLSLCYRRPRRCFHFIIIPNTFSWVKVSTLKWMPEFDFFFKLALRVLIAFRFTKESAESIFESSDVLTWRSHYFFFGLLSWKEILSLESQYECHQFDSFGLNRSDRLKSHHFEWCGCDWSSLL